MKKDGNYIMKKVAIMTWFRYANYGSVLQAYALGTYLKKKEYEITYLDYIPNKAFPKSLISRVMSDEFIAKAKEVLYDRSNPINEDIKNREKLFNIFVENHFNISKRCETNAELANLSSEFEAVICGSDQIWSPIVFDEKYYLGFVDKNTRTIAYAPSFGMTKIRNMDVKNEISSALKNIDFLSVREDSGIDLIENMTGRKAQVVVDPTLLLSRNEWSEMEETYSDVPLKPYVLFYLLGNHRFYNQYIDWYKKNGYEILIIPFHNYDYKRSGKIAKSVSPGNFINLVKNAEGVCTDSFHGTVFSILYNKPFVSLARFKDNESISQNERLYALLELTDEKDRFAKNFSIGQAKLLFRKLKSLDKLNERIDQSYAFLDNALKFEHNEKSYSVDFITKNCSGCGVCKSSCPTKSIDIKLNKYGFYESSINKNTCIDCHLCEKICGFNGKNNRIEKAKVYALRSKNKNLLMNSASGGFATEISLLLCNDNYKIIGCQYDYKVNEAKHVIVDNKADIRKLAGSKYLQSHVDNILNIIDHNSKYLFIGTPCQVASLNNYLEKKGIRENFILIDLICHGVPSYNLWKKYLGYISKKYLNNEKINEIKFRKKVSKSTNNNMNMYIKTKNNCYLHSQEKDLFFKFFCLGNVYSKACYNCNFRVKSCADIRIGDYWGNTYKEIPGTSMVLVLTDRGEKIIDLYKDYFVIDKGEWKDYQMYQQNENINPPNNYVSLMEELNNGDILKAYHDYCRDYYVLNPIKDIVKKLIRR